MRSWPDWNWGDGKIWGSGLHPLIQRITNTQPGEICFVPGALERLTEDRATDVAKAYRDADLREMIHHHRTQDAFWNPSSPDQRYAAASFQAQYIEHGIELGREPNY